MISLQEMIKNKECTGLFNENINSHILKYIADKRMTSLHNSLEMTLSK